VGIIKQKGLAVTSKQIKDALAGTSMSKNSRTGRYVCRYTRLDNLNQDKEKFTVQ